MAPVDESEPLNVSLDLEEIAVCWGEGGGVSSLGCGVCIFITSYICMLWDPAEFHMNVLLFCFLQKFSSFLIDGRGCGH